MSSQREIQRFRGAAGCHPITRRRHSSKNRLFENVLPLDSDFAALLLHSLKLFRHDCFRAGDIVRARVLSLGE